MPQVNTGVVERRQKDVNPNSPTFGQFRWIAAGVDLVLCPRTGAFQSAQISETVYRSDCGTGVSTGVTYTVPAGHVSDSTSQADVDARARIYFNSTKEAYAAAHATCSAAPARPEVYFIRHEYQNNGIGALVLTFGRTDTNGQLRINYTLTLDGQSNTERAFFADGQQTVDVIPQTSTASTNPTPPNVDAVVITSTMPNTYDIRP
jgi:hypothetical protein